MLAPEKIANLKTLYLQGLSYTEVMKETGLARSTVSRHCSGLRKPGRAGAPRRISYGRVRELHRAGLSQHKIAGALRVSVSLVNRIVRQP